MAQVDRANPSSNWAQTLTLPPIPCLALLWQPWEGPGWGRPFVPWVSLTCVLACPCVPVLFQAYRDRQAFDGSYDGPGSILAGQAITWASSPSTPSLHSFLDVLTSFLPHNLHWQENLLFGSFMLLRSKFFVECLELKPT